MTIVKAAGVTRVRVFGGKGGSKSTTRREEEERTGGSEGLVRRLLARDGNGALRIPF